MPVECCAFFGIGDCVIDGDLNSVAPIGFNRWLYTDGLVISEYAWNETYAWILAVH